MKRMTVLAIGATMMTATAAAALPPLREVEEIDRPMLWVAMAIEITDKCESLAPRTFKGLNYLWTLKRKAEAMGYSQAEIRAYVDSKDEEARIRALGEAYARERGYDPDRVEDLCALGKSEIAAGSVVGSLMRVR